MEKIYFDDSGLGMSIEDLVPYFLFKVKELHLEGKSDSEVCCEFVISFFEDSDSDIIEILNVLKYNYYVEL